MPGRVFWHKLDSLYNSNKCNYNFSSVLFRISSDVSNNPLTCYIMLPNMFTEYWLRILEHNLFSNRLPRTKFTSFFCLRSSFPTDNITLLDIFGHFIYFIESVLTTNSNSTTPSDHIHLLKGKCFSVLPFSLSLTYTY